jgi:hypothetical protein
MLKFKKSVRIKTYSLPVKEILDSLFLIDGTGSPDLPEDIWITSINDSRHSSNSRHYTDEAIDVRSKNFRSRQAKRDFRSQLEIQLNMRYGFLVYRVLLEKLGKKNEHFHVQVRKGTKHPSA